MKPKVFIIDGHTLPTDNGAISNISEYKELTEAVLIRKVSPYVVESLNQLNFLQVIPFNVDYKNYNHPLDKKIKVINYSYSNRKEDIAVELHFDFVSDMSVGGHSVIIGTNDMLGIAFRDTFKIKEINNRGILTVTKYWNKARYDKYNIKKLNRTLGMIEQTKISSIIVENLFVSSINDMGWLTSDLETNVKRLAFTIVEGIKAYYLNRFNYK